MPPPVTATESALGALAATVFATLRLDAPLVLLNWLASLPVTRAPVLWPSKLLLKLAPSGEAVVPETGAVVVAGAVAAGASAAVVAGRVGAWGYHVVGGVVEGNGRP